jgi:hypothetical protein
MFAAGRAGPVGAVGFKPQRDGAQLPRRRAPSGSADRKMFVRWP